MLTLTGAHAPQGMTPLRIAQICYNERMYTPGQLVRRVRADCGLTQAQLARRAGTTQSAISRLERDAYSPTVESLQAIMVVLGSRLSLDDLVPAHPIDRELLVRSNGLTHQQRFHRALGANRVARRFYMEGQRVRGSR